MNLEQIRARLVAIQTALEGLTAGPDGYTAEQIAEIETLNTEFEGLTAQAETVEKVEAMKAKAAASKGRRTEPVAPAVRVDVGASATDRFGGFKSTGEYLMAVKRAGSHGEIHKNFQNTAYEKNGEDGGFLVPEEMSEAILKKLESAESLVSATTELKISGSSLVLNVDESQPWNQGVTAYWTGEGQPITASKNALKQASFRLNKLACLVPATDELLDDAVAMQSWIMASAPAAIMHKLNSAIISGNGVGKPQGIINSPFAVTVDKESMQTNDTIVARNLIKMYSRMIPSFRAGGAWYINAGCEEALMTLVDDNDNFIYIAPGTNGQLSASPYGTLLGRPVYPLMSGIPELGDAGDVIFANLKSYYTVQKAQGIKSASSIHLAFDKEITNFRFSLRVDGKSPFQSPVTTEFGDHQMSAFVILGARGA